VTATAFGRSASASATSRNVPDVMAVGVGVGSHLVSLPDGSDEASFPSGLAREQPATTTTATIAEHQPRLFRSNRRADCTIGML